MQDPLLSVPRTAVPPVHSMEIEDEVPVTTNSDTSSSVPAPVTTNSDISLLNTSPVTTAPSSVIVSARCSLVNSTTATVTATSTSTFAATIPPVTASATCLSVTVTTARVTMSSTSTAATFPPVSTSALKVKIRHTVKTFRLQVAKKYPCVELPDFDNVTGKEWDTRAKAYIRRVKIMIEDREIGLTARDYASWTIDDIRELTNPFFEILSVRNYLVNFTYGLLQSHWKISKIHN